MITAPALVELLCCEQVVTTPPPPAHPSQKHPVTYPLLKVAKRDLTFFELCENCNVLHGSVIFDFEGRLVWINRKLRS